MHKTKTIYTLAIITVIIIGVIVYISINRETTQIYTYKCPEAYAEDEVGTIEYRKAITGWTSEFFKENPNATMSDWSKAKTQLWIDNNCTVAMQRSKMSGNVSDLKPWEKVDYEIQNALDKITY